MKKRIFFDKTVSVTIIDECGEISSLELSIDPTGLLSICSKNDLDGVSLITGVDGKILLESLEKLGVNNDSAN